MRALIAVVLFAFSFSAAAGGLINRSKRVQVLRESGLEKDVVKMDELDRDLLVLAASTKTTDDLTAKYPELAPAKLKKMQELLKVQQ